MSHLVGAARCGPIVAALFVVSAWSAAHAQTTLTHRGSEAQGSGDMRFALGVSASFELRQDFADDTRANWNLALLGHSYFRLSQGAPWFLRPGLRIGYGGIAQAEMPNDLHLTERDLTVFTELGVIYDWVVMPSLTVGIGMIGRWIDLQAEGAVQPSDALDQFDLLGSGYVQLGIGIPLARGRLVLEPFARLQYTPADDRSLWGLGVDATIGF